MQARNSALIVLATILSFSTQAKNAFEFNAGLALGYDNDVSVDEIDLTTAKGDQFATARLSASAQVETLENQNLKGSYHFSNKHYADFNQFDLQTHLFSTSYDVKFDKVSGGVTLRYADSNLNNKGFLTLTQWAPYISWFVNKQHYLRFAYTYSDKSLVNNPLRDATSNEFATDYYYFANGLNSYFIAAVVFKREDANDEQFDYDSQKLRLGYQYRLDLMDFPTKVKLDVSYRRKDYNAAINQSIGEYRLDKNIAVGGMVELEIAADLSVQLDLEYTDNVSNLAAVDYTQWVSSVALNYQF